VAGRCQGRKTPNQKFTIAAFEQEKTQAGHTKNQNTNAKDELRDRDNLLPQISLRTGESGDKWETPGGSQQPKNPPP